MTGRPQGAAPLGASGSSSRMRWDVLLRHERHPASPGPDARRVLPGPRRPTAPTAFYGNHIGVGPTSGYTNHHYDTTVSETRITSYLGIITGQVPATHYFAMWRTFPGDCDWSWQEMQPVGENRTYLGVDVYEGAYTYRGMHIVPGWGGSMFEELMPDVFVPESSWAPRSWGLNHPLHVRAQREHGLDEAGYGYWGFSPSSNPAGGYREYGVDVARAQPRGLLLRPGEDRTSKLAFGDCRDATQPEPHVRRRRRDARTRRSSR